MTKEQLQIGLRLCLASSAHFAEFCLPLLEEKLESDLIAAKVESLKALVCSFVIINLESIVFLSCVIFL